MLMHGVEPNMQWRSFCAELLAIADKLNVDTVLIPRHFGPTHPYPPVPVSGAAYPESAKFFGLERRGTKAHGHAGVSRMPVAAGIPAVTFWAAVPHYVLTNRPTRRRPSRCCAASKTSLDIEVPSPTLPTQAEEWEQAVTDATADDGRSPNTSPRWRNGDAEVDEQRRKFQGGRSDALTSRIRTLSEATLGARLLKG